MTDDRLIIISNRLPISAVPGDDGIHVTPSSGGLATGLRRWHAQSNGLWFGWPGDVSAASLVQRGEFDRQLQQRGIVPVHLSADQVSRYYDGFANGVLWPLFHYQIDRIPVDASGWDAYREVNEVFAEAIAGHWRPNDLIWVHDYQLMLLPALLRQRLPEARIGFFLHVPFPASEVFRILPWRHELLAGVLGADLVGFHTFAYMRHFMTSLLHVDGVEADLDRVRVGSREVMIGVFPMGVDAAGFGDLAASADVQARVATLRREAGGRRILLGVDRLDYTKGIPRRLAAVERLFEQHPSMRDGIRYIQVAVPSRGEVAAYQQFRRTIEEQVGRLNGAYGTLESLPVHYVHQSVAPQDLVALYGAADVMLVTPLRDGMNLVAKEYVASRVDEDGVLVLSEFAGAATELQGAVCINPYDVDASADAIHRALSMPASEKRARMRGLRRRVIEQDVNAWAEGFTRQLRRVRSDERKEARRAAPPLAGAVAAAHAKGRLRLLLDYDGTLVPLARSPQLAKPDDELMALLAGLAASPRIEVDIVSGRRPDDLERWFGELRLGLWAEHGFWHRPRTGESWQAAVPLAGNWMDRIKDILDQFAATTPGAQVEVKSASLAWHYRGASREFGARQAHELRLLLGDLLSNQPLEVLEGKKVIEVRVRGVSKGLVAQRVEAERPPGTTILAIGDDRTDEELFRALSPSCLTVAVGRRWTAAAYVVEDHRAVRAVLRMLLGEAGESVERRRRVDLPLPA
jgi:trehalose 6-phosphate synthase/phosphatase